MARDVSSSRRRREEHTLFGVPARFMAPRIILFLTTFALASFGMLMIYSSSSISAMTDVDLNYDASYYVVRQLIACGIGFVAAAIIYFTDYHIWSRILLPAIWLVTFIMLLILFTPLAGQDVYGATRWIDLPGFTLQPSEFAKVTIILTAANIAMQYFEERSIDLDSFVKLIVLGVGAPLLMILLQPDKGSTIICAATLLVMGYLAGFSRSFLWTAIVAGAAFVLFMALKDDYSRQRIITMFNPWVDEEGAGYQLIQGYYAFGTGGLFGVGIGMSRQKYSYLPMAHSDFIFAVIGEELGLVGTLGLIAVFLVFAWAGLRIARYAPDLAGRLIAAGCTSMILIQLFVNILGVLGLLPLTGKPIPFVSSGGSSVLSCLILVGFISSVSRASVLPETAFDAQRRSWGVASDDDYDDPELSLVGEATPRSARGTSQAPSFTVLGGGRTAGRDSSAYRSAGSWRDTSPEALRASRDFDASTRGRVSVDANGRRRIDLGPDASDRLRSSRRGSRP